MIIFGKTKPVNPGTDKIVSLTCTTLPSDSKVSSNIWGGGGEGRARAPKAK